ncbi:MAG TPA: hypothetical protein VI636_15040 [Candidatus Angelobacter sp.]
MADGPKRVVILLTSSDNDRQQLTRKPGFWISGKISYIECDQGTTCSKEPIAEAQRLLAIISDDHDSDLNTRRVNEVLTKCNGFQPVIGTHTGIADPSTVLATSLLVVRVPLNPYTAGGTPYAFIKPWCEELAKKDPASDKIREGFDRLFDLFYKSEGLHQWIDFNHQFANILKPFEVDFGGWPRQGFPDGYFRDRKLQPFPTDKARRLLYKSAGGPNHLTLERAVEDYLGSVHATEAAKVESSWKRITNLLPASDPPVADASFLSAVEAINQLQTVEGRRILKTKLTERKNPVLEWIKAIKAELRILSKILVPDKASGAK